MKKILIPLLVLILLFVSAKLLLNILKPVISEKQLVLDVPIYKNSDDFGLLKTGDIVFRSPVTDTDISEKQAFGCEMPRIGIVLQSNPLEIYAVKDSLQLMDFDEWIDVGVETKFTVKRLLDSIYMDELLHFIESRKGVAHDFYYTSDNKRLYPSEFVWKAFKACNGIELCPPAVFDSCAKAGKSIKKILLYRSQQSIRGTDPFYPPKAVLHSKYLKTVLVK